jgi:hypothetical protein
MHMLRSLRVSLALATGLLLSSAITASAADEWVSLFDGKTLSGWESLELPNQKVPSKWEVVDGELRGSGGQSMLFSPKGDYVNCKFRAEIKINDKGNSGMYFRTPKANTFTGGYEAQINSTHGDPIKTGSVYTFVHVYDQIVAPDTWFTQEVDVRTVDFRGKTVNQIEIRVNDKLLYRFLDHGTTWKTGHFAFQQHDPGSKVSIRKIEVMELPLEKK